MHTSAGTLTYNAYIGATVSGEENKVGASLTINVVAPFLKITVTGSNRARIDPQTSVISASLLAEVVNDQQQNDYSLDLDVYGQYQALLSPTGGVYQPYLFSPTVTSKPASPAKIDHFEIKNTLKVTSPDRLGEISVSIFATGKSASGKKIPSAMTTLRF